VYVKKLQFIYKC